MLPLRQFVAAARSRLSGVRIVLEDLSDPGNRAAILRSVEAFGLLHVHEVRSSRLRVGSTARGRSIVNGAEKWLTLHQHSDIRECLTSLKASQHALLAAVPPGKGRQPLPLESLRFDRPTALLFGSEAWGISSEALELCDATFTVPLPGLSESLNVSVAVAVCVHFAAFRRREALGLAPHEGDLQLEEVEELQESYAERSRENRFAASLRASRARKARDESQALAPVVVEDGERVGETLGF
ncbi:trmH [Symbiodinium natans]|uniref:TrmH protein n=1 Tax=Symbiodinium natans TaxID=878477 RepID=A0A812MB25_9DINO|nr:trmH [Symbiodinium natans]